LDPGDAATNNNNANIPLLPDGQSPLNNGTFTLSGDNDMLLPSGTYYFTGDFKISGGADLKITGPTTIWVDGEFTIEGNASVNPTLSPSNLAVFLTKLGSGDNLKYRLLGTSSFYGIVYAPAVKFEVTDNSQFYGALTALELEIEHSSLGGPNQGVHFDEDLEDPEAMRKYMPKTAILVD